MEINCQILAHTNKKGNKLTLKQCKYCNNDFFGSKQKIFCSQQCLGKWRYSYKYEGLEEGYDYIVCPICNQKMGQMVPRHAKMHGFDSIEEMQNKLNFKITCEKLRLNSVGENNPGWKHNGKFSAWSENFVNGYDKERHDRHKKQSSDFIKSDEGKKSSIFHIEYWIEKYPNDLEKAKEEYTKSQTRDLRWFIEKFGEDEGKIRHLAKTRKWSKSFKKTNFSKVSQELFDLVYNQLIFLGNIYYATLEREDMKEYKNKEYILFVGNTYVRPDFICLERKKVIEFDGDYWHSEKVANPIREAERNQKIIDAGYELLHIKECDFKKDQQGAVNKCLKFLNW